MDAGISLLAVVAPHVSASTEGGEGLALGITLALFLVSLALCRYSESLHADLDRISRIIFMSPRVWDRPPAPSNGSSLLRDAPTAVLFVEGYDGVGLESLLAIGKMLRGAFSQILFLTVRVFDGGDVKERGPEARRLKGFVEKSLEKYGSLAELLYLGSGQRVRLGNNPVDEGVRLAEEVHRDYPRSVFFFPRLAPEPSRWYYRFLESTWVRDVPDKLRRRGFVTVELWCPVTIRCPRALATPLRT